MSRDPRRRDRRVLMLMPQLAGHLANEAGERFTIVGPWQGASEAEWWAGAPGRGLRVGISSGIDVWDAGLLERLPDLEEIVVYGAGQAGIDLEAMKRRGVRINASSAHAGDVAEHGTGLILASWRRLADGDRWIRENRWATQGRMPMSRRLFGRRVGIVGLGNIGRELARRMESLGCGVGWWGPRDKLDAPWPRAASLRDLAKESDVLAVTVFAHEGARKLISAEIIEALGPEGLLVNLSRGFVVDEDALITALRDGRLGYAALDVFEAEPTPGERWRDVPNCLLTPHSAGTTPEASAALRARAFEAVEAVLARGKG